MAHRRNEDFYLYTGLCVDNGECYNALMHLRSLNQATFKFKHLHYGEPAQHQQLLDNLKTWDPTIETLTFPFVVYTKVNDFEDTPNRVPAFVLGFQAIANTDWQALYDYVNTDPVPVPEANTSANTGV